MGNSACRHYVFGFVLVVALCVTWAGAQNTASVSGRVTDPTGSVLPGSEVELENLETGATRVAVTGDEGRYRAQNLTLGTYRVSASLPGFQTIVRSGIVLTIGREAVVNLQLPIGEISERVEVTGDAPLVETTSSELSALVTRDQISNLPLNARDFSQLITLQAGTTNYRQQEGGGHIGYGARISVNGARPDASSFTLDGSDITTPTGLLPAGVSNATLGIEAMREFKVLTSSYSAQYGRSGGASLIAVTRSGTNAFHGSLYEYHRNDNLDARNFFDSGKPELKQNQFGFSMGGPMVPDRAFFFASYEGLRERTPLRFREEVPTVEARTGLLPDGQVPNVDPVVFPYLDLFPLPTPGGLDFGDGGAEFIRDGNRPTNHDYFVVRLDHELNDNHSLFGRYTFDDSEKSTEQAFQLFTEQESQRNQYITLEGRSVLSPTFLNQARLSYSRYNLERDLAEGVRAPDPSLSFVTGRPFGGVAGLGIASNIPGYTGTVPRQLNLNTYQASDDMTYDRGSHSLKFGWTSSWFIFNKKSFGRYGGAWTFRSYEDFLQNKSPSRLRLMGAGADAVRTYTQWMNAFYIQDDVQLRPNLTMNLGLRYEYVAQSQERYGRGSNLINFLTDSAGTVGPFFTDNPSGDDFAPRIGLAWDPTGSGDYSIRAGFGVFQSPIIVRQTMNVFDRVDPFWQEIDARSLGDGFFPDLDPELARLTAGTKAIHFYESAPKSPYMMQWSLSLQGMVAPNLVAEVAYSGSRGNHLSVVSRLDVPEPQFCGSTAPAAVCAGKPAGVTFFPEDAPFLNPTYTRLQHYQNAGSSSYHALKMILTKRLSQGLQFQGAYTYAKSLDNGSAVVAGVLTDTWGQDPFNINEEWGPSDFHIEHTFVTNYSYDLPFGRSLRWGQSWNGVVDGVLGGWQVAGIMTFTSGTPDTINSSRLITHDSAARSRPDLAPGADPNPILPGGVQCNADCRYFDTSAFVPQQKGFYGNVGRNTLIGPGLAALDISLLKNIYIGSDRSKKVQFRAEFFNFLNHTNFRTPSSTVFRSRGRPQSSAGRINGVVTQARQVQLALRIEF